MEAVSRTYTERSHHIPFIIQGSQLCNYVVAISSHESATTLSMSLSRRVYPLWLRRFLPMRRFLSVRRPAAASFINSSLSKSRGPDAQDVNPIPQWADPCGSQALLSSSTTDYFTLLAAYAATLAPRGASSQGGELQCDSSKSYAQSMWAFRNRVLPSSSGRTLRATVTGCIVWGDFSDSPGQLKRRFPYSVRKFCQIVSL